MKVLILQGVLLPFIGTTLGASCVLMLRKQLSSMIQRCLGGAAAGVMAAASVWSLLLPAISQSERMGHAAFVPALAGLLTGMGFLLLLDRLIPQQRPDSQPKGTAMLVLAVTMHNIPEGMAVGALFAGLLYGNGGTMAAAMALSAGVAVQNIPEGAIISLPLKAEGMSGGKAFVCGMLSGAVEPAAAVMTLAAAGMIVPLMPYLLSFAAGAMLCVVVEELIPEMSAGTHSSTGTVLFALGFGLMMSLDVALG